MAWFWWLLCAFQSVLVLDCVRRGWRLLVVIGALSAPITAWLALTAR